ncbi:hypothetical protein EDD86DRAFT_107823 [Gorgonomyces haynaldii]|nr:hypothetical protein EDD86DRAFT_107823 [Gorgonomyces haynaldii]
MNAKQNPLFTFIAERYQQPEFQPSMLSGYRTKLPVFPPDTILTPLDPTASPIQIRSLLEQSPVVIVALRRPGCFMCRYSALLMQRHIQKINDLGGRLIAVCKEDVGLPEFVDKVWKQELYIDFDMQVYRYLWDGELVKTSMAFNAINPRFWNNVKEAQTMYPDSNFEGEGQYFG